VLAPVLKMRRTSDEVTGPGVWPFGTPVGLIDIDDSVDGAFVCPSPECPSSGDEGRDGPRIGGWIRGCPSSVDDREDGGNLLPLSYHPKWVSGKP